VLTRRVPKTGEELPAVGLGTWPMFDVGSEERAREPLREVVRRLIEGGGRVIDSSPMYGRAEAVVGALVEELGARDKVFLATKVWTTGRERGIAEICRSAERLRTPTIDLLQIHNLVDWRTHLETLRTMKERGEVRYIGLTHYTDAALPELARILKAEPDIDFVQCAYSLSQRAAERELLPVAAGEGVAVLLNRPLGQGGLFGRVRGRKLPDWARDFDCAGWAEFFLKYVLAEPAVTCVIPATGDPTHMADNLAAGTGRLPDAQQRQRMREFWEGL
jgi:aryl-alcohol dehydrogenase-like predicted oxidoreductase